MATKHVIRRSSSDTGRGTLFVLVRHHPRHHQGIQAVSQHRQDPVCDPGTFFRSLMIILTALSFVGGILAFILVTLSIASGLYYVSEFVEEHSAFSKRMITYGIYTICGVLVLSLIDGMPWYLVLLGLFSQGIYFTNLTTFPIIQLSSGRFVSACALVFVNHYLWFRHFGEMQRLRQTISFGQVASFFGICVWLVPFALFVSLSAGENILPTTDVSQPTTPKVGQREASSYGFGTSSSRRGRAGGLVKTTYSWIGDRVQPMLQILGVVKGDDEILAAHRRYA